MLVLHIWREHRGENWSMNNSRNHKAIKASPPSPHREQVWEILQEIYRSAAAIQGPTWWSFKVNVLNQVCHLGLLLCLSSSTMYIFIFTFSWIVFHWGIRRLFSFFLPPKYSHTHTHTKINRNTDCLLFGNEFCSALCIEFLRQWGDPCSLWRNKLGITTYTIKSGSFVKC